MTDEQFMRLMLKRVRGDGQVVNVRALPERICRSITHVVLTSPFLGLRGELEFNFEADEDGDVFEITWGRGDGTMTKWLIADGEWFCCYRGAYQTYVTRLDTDHEKEVDTTTFEAILLMAGEHPTQKEQV